ncbi:FAD-dependent monooxygenase atmM [Fusarium oxysporum f. sp. raphani]|uniref:FAD-dependent monooxygenase atmM n=1 Tax=Fusarium oxysporum f. sp. raphani TaxID=96318 RepID=A0A8J5P8Y3_FUSOX|nr:FAD-dependent monooxygenase atmM [Fusarium oxysporum f. sp. raphani]
MSSNNFKVVIAGGGIAGLALANMLEQFDLDYVLLEAHSDIAPPVGASIGMFPNGLRILDQIGCYQPIKDIFGDQVPYNVTNTRNEKGEVIAHVDGIFDHLERRHGYGLFFFDRQSLLQILYEHIQHKDRIHLRKKATEISFVEKGVEVTCSDGSVVSGTFLVGADGIHSQVRRSMHRLGHTLEPGYFDIDEEDKVQCYYACSFGIAQNVPNWPVGQQSMVTGKGKSQLVVSGPDNRVYWFLFEKLPGTKHGKDIPRYTKEDEAEFVNRNHNVAITPEVTFGQVFAKRLSSTLTPLHEVVYKKWFFKRVITLGDSVHKPNPIGGQGANGAIESCAELINSILQLKDTREGGLSNLSDRDVHKIFSEVQSARYEQANAIVNRSHFMQSLFAYENPVVSTIVWDLLGSLGGDEGTLNQMAPVYLGGTTLKQLPVPYRPRAIPFHDELPAKPMSKKISDYVRYGFIGGMGLAVLATNKALRLPIEEVSALSKSLVQIRWFGDSPASEILNTVVSLFGIPIFDKDPSPRVQLFNFLPQLISPLLIYAIEGHRLGNQGTILSIPSLFSVAMKSGATIARVAPVYAILSSFFGFENPPSRAVPLHVAKSLIPAITVGFLIPTIMALTPTPRVQAWENWCALWQLSPLLFNLLVGGISAGIKKWKGEEKRDGERDMSRYEAKDVSALQSVYTFAFAVQATAHIASLAYGWNHPDVSLSKTFLDFPNIFKADWSLPSLSAKVATMLKFDMAFAVVGYLGSQLYSIWDLRRLGYVKTDEAIKAGVATLAGQWLVGSGATWAGLWYWRERKIATVGA